MTTRTPTFILLLFASAVVMAQKSSLKLITEVPLQIGVEYEGMVSKRISVTGSIGLLTPPNNTIIVNVLEALGTNEQITLMIQDAFKFGVVGQLGVNYNFRKYYVGGFFQTIALHAGDTPTDLIENYFGTSIDSYPTRRNRTPANEPFLALKSTLYQAGILLGRRFPFKNRLEIDAEVGVSANVVSKSILSSQYRDLSSLSVAVNDELAGYYSSYAFIPSVKLCLVYKFKA